MIQQTSKQETYDLIVIGGGIAGASITRDAVLRGYSTLLLEKSTIGSGTSSKSSHLIHGGIRYLESSYNALKRLDLIDSLINLKFVFHSLNEARILENIAQSDITSLPIIIPIYEQTRRSLTLTHLGAWIYYVLARITGPARAPKLLKNKKEVLEKLPLLKQEGLMGGVLIWERLTDDLKLTNRIAYSAKEKGAQVFEYAEVLRYIHDPRNKQYQVTYVINNAERVVYSKKIINASGPWIDILRKRSDTFDRPFVYPLAGAHIHTNKFINHTALLETEDKRLIFIVVRDNDLRIGTTERYCDNLDDVRATNEDKDYLIKNLNDYFPSCNFTRNDILNHDAGIRPLAERNTKIKASDISREHHIFIDKLGVLHVAGVKLTDHRRCAEEAVNRIRQSFKQNTRISSCKTKHAPL